MNAQLVNISTTAQVPAKTVDPIVLDVLMEIHVLSAPLIRREPPQKIAISRVLPELTTSKQSTDHFASTVTAPVKHAQDLMKINALVAKSSLSILKISPPIQAQTCLTLSLLITQQEFAESVPLAWKISMGSADLAQTTVLLAKLESAHSVDLDM